jgi:hypothetical protein
MVEVDLMEFHIGDKVCLLYAGRPVSFTVDAISSGPDGKGYYIGEGAGGWQPEDRLDYDTTPTQDAVLATLERAMHQAAVAIRDAAEAERDAVASGVPAAKIKLIRDAAGLA